MKSTREPFDDELRGRLVNYTDEPSQRVWQAIASKIFAVNPEPVWVVWSARISVMVVFSLVLLFFNEKDRFSVKAGLNQMTSETSDIGNSAVPSPHQTDNIQVTKEHRTKRNEIRNNRLAFAAGEQDHFLRLPDERLTLTSLPLAASVAVIPDLSLSDTTKFTRGKDNKLLSVRDSTEKKKSIRPGKNQRRQKLFSLYFMAMPTFGYQRIESNDHDKILIEGIKSIPAFSRDRLGVRIEVGVEGPLSKRWKVLGGVVYYQRKQTIEYIETQVDGITISKEADGNLIIEPQLSSLQKSADYELKNIGLQVGLTYQLWMKDRKVTAEDALSSKSLPIRKKRFAHLIGTGIEFHKALRESSSFKTAEGFPDPSTYVFFNLYYRLQYPNAGRLRAIFQPTLNYSFYINKDLNAPFYVKPYGLGLNFGCTYHFW